MTQHSFLRGFPEAGNFMQLQQIFTSYIYCLFKCNVLIDLADHPSEVLWPICVAYADVVAIPGMTVTQRSERCYYSEAGWSYNHHLPLSKKEDFSCHL